MNFVCYLIKPCRKHRQNEKKSAIYILTAFLVMLFWRPKSCLTRILQWPRSIGLLYLFLLVQNSNKTSRNLGSSKDIRVYFQIIWLSLTEMVLKLYVHHFSQVGQLAAGSLLVRGLHIPLQLFVFDPGDLPISDAQTSAQHLHQSLNRSKHGLLYFVIFCTSFQLFCKVLPQIPQRYCNSQNVAESGIDILDV